MAAIIWTKLSPSFIVDYVMNVTLFPDESYFFEYNDFLAISIISNCPFLSPATRKFWNLEFELNVDRSLIYILFCAIYYCTLP